jgi:23S rRNA (cytosine1962-C5)-methyltransferase
MVGPGYVELTRRVRAEDRSVLVTVGGWETLSEGGADRSPGRTEVRLKLGREKSVRNRHPWIFSGAIEEVAGDGGAGDAVEVADARGRWLARGAWSPRSQIRVRLWTWDADEALDAALIRDRIERAFAHRTRFVADRSDAYRVVFSEADGLPGLVADRYGAWVVVQVASAGVAARLDDVVAGLRDVLEPRGILERSDEEARAKEGLPPQRRLLWGEEPPAEVEIREAGLRWLVDLAGGQKTGAYLDQRDNRQRVGALCQGREVLSCFSYAGGFELHAAGAGAAAVVGVDSSAAALELAERNRRLNGIELPIVWRRANVFEELRRLRAEGRRFDAVLLDPPKLVPVRGKLERGLRAYKDLNLLAMQLLRTDGLLATFSCSGLVSADLFQKVVFGASIDAGRQVQIVDRLGQPPDHPVLLSFPESDYLNGLICRVL